MLINKESCFFLGGIDPIQPYFYLAVIADYVDGVSIGDGHDFGGPGKTGGWYGEQKKEKGEANTVRHEAVHAGLP